jgi:hypothetical protein
MTDQHPIIPPPQLVQQWCNNPRLTWLERLSLAYAAGADQELEACCEWLRSKGFDHTDQMAKDLLAARRPKPPSLKEQGLKSLDEVILCLKMLIPGAPVDGIHIENIRRALEALPK